MHQNETETENDGFSDVWRYTIPPRPKDYRYKGKIVLFYGPYEVHHVIKRLPDKLRGLKDMLEKDGYKVRAVPWEVYDMMAVVLNENVVYTCRYSFMDFDGFGQDHHTKEAYLITSQALARINGWYFIKYFKKKKQMDFFNATFGK